GDVEKVKADGEGVTTEQFEADEYGGEESGGHMSLGSTVGKDNDSGFGSSVGHENVADFATLVGEDNVVAATHGEEESEAVLDGNETKVWDSDEHGSLVGSDKDEEHEDATIKDHPKMKLREIQRICASEMHDYAQELTSRMPSSTIKVVVQRVTADSPPHFKSEFITAVRRDANNQMFLIAWAVVEVDCTDPWGLEIAISDILTRMEHRNCARHMFANWSGRKLGKSFEFNFWKIMKSIIERSFLGTTCKSNLVDNNLCEAFNSSIVEARFKSIIRMLEDIGTKMMTRIPINGPYDWAKIGIEPVLPPIERKMPGRPKKNGRMAKDEPKKLKSGHLSRKGSSKDSSGQSSSMPKSPKNKRKAPLNHLATQESVTGNMSNSSKK
ncbi:hypothetical protein Gogos_016701, partial [Gossypium gossypioides]|nr:hypothetical protein [Gossypium gossypioides]